MDLIRGARRKGIDVGTLVEVDLFNGVTFDRTSDFPCARGPNSKTKLKGIRVCGYVSYIGGEDERESYLNIYPSPNPRDTNLGGFRIYSGAAHSLHVAHKKKR